VSPRHDSFAALRFMAALKAARDFGLNDATANQIALGFDPRRPNVARLADQLGDALIEQGAFRVPA
jgi:hypothetical protein